jgi:hypothetical protein
MARISRGFNAAEGEGTRQPQRLVSFALLAVFVCELVAIAKLSLSLGRTYLIFD